MDLTVDNKTESVKLNPQNIIEELKKKLTEEGLFDSERKRELPLNPKTVGMITSPSGAAVRDMITVARRRNRGIKLLLFPVKVQGDGSAAEIVRAIRFMNKHRLADVLIVGRGGGSIEELWAFNEEPVVRAIAASEIPVVSAVGHETDFTLSDFAADRRAAGQGLVDVLFQRDAFAAAHAFIGSDHRTAVGIKDTVAQGIQQGVTRWKMAV